MIKVTLMYPYAEGARFDHAYYRDRHMPLVKSRLGDACSYYTVEKGLAGRAPGSSPAFIATCAFICDSVDSYQAAMQQHGAELRADVANYTDIAPVLQFSEVVIERSESSPETARATAPDRGGLPGTSDRAEHFPDIDI